MSDISRRLLEMDYGASAEDTGKTMELLYPQYGPFINGKWRILATMTNDKFCEIKDPWTGKNLTNVRVTNTQDINDAIKSSLSTHASRRKHDYKNVSQFMNGIATLLQKQSQLFSHIDSLSRGVLVKDAREFDVPQMINVFKYYSSSMYDTFQERLKLIPEPVTVGIMTENTPLVALAWLIAPAIASESCVCLVVPHQMALPAMLFAQMFFENSAYDSVLNVLPGDQATIDGIVTHNKVSNVVYFGPTKIARHIREITSGTGKHCTTALMSGKSSMLVFDTADLDAVVESVVKYAWYNLGTVPWAVKKLFIQEPVFQVFVEKLKRRLLALRIGQPFDLLADVGLPYDDETRDAVAKVVLKAREAGIEVFQVPIPDYFTPERFFSPTVLIGEDVQTNCLLDDEVSVPVISVVPFRTAKEAISMANNSRYGIAASIWLEGPALAFSVADQLKVGTVWINSHGLMDPAVPFGGRKESGIGCFGGIQLTNMMKSAYIENTAHAQVQLSGDVPRISGETLHPIPESLDTQQKRVVVRDQVHIAVQAAVTAQARWAVAVPRIRAETMHAISERLDAQLQQLGSLMSEYGDKTYIDYNNVIGIIRSTVWNCASEAGLTIRPSVTNTTVNVSKEPLGVVGIGISTKGEQLPLLMITVAAALCYGNAVVIALENSTPSSVTDILGALLKVVPQGLVTVLTGNATMLMEMLAQHQSVDAIWDPNCSGNVAKVIESYAAQDMKRLCINSEISYDQEFLERKLTQNKAVWLPKLSNIC